MMKFGAPAGSRTRTVGARLSNKCQGGKGNKLKVCPSISLALVWVRQLDLRPNLPGIIWTAESKTARLLSVSTSVFGCSHRVSRRPLASVQPAQRRQKRVDTFPRGAAWSCTHRGARVVLSAHAHRYALTASQLHHAAVSGLLTNVKCSCIRSRTSFRWRQYW